jgi:signal transduction histidine kinase
LGDQLATVGGTLAVARLFALFPDGRYGAAYERRILRPLFLLAATPFLLVLSAPKLVLPEYLFEKPVPVLSSPLAVSFLHPVEPVARALYDLTGLAFVAALVLLVLRYRRASAEQRLRIRWLLLAAVLAATVALFELLVRVSGVVSAHTLDSLYLVTNGPIVLLFLAAILIALFRHRLLDVDVVIRRSLVYGALSLLIGGAYVGAAAVLGLAAGARLPLAVAVLVTIAATLGFQPVRRRLDRLAGRAVFGQRLTRYELLNRFGETLEHAFDLSELAPQIASTVRDGLDLRWARLVLALEAGGSSRLEPVAAAGIGLADPESPDIVVPLVHADERVGAIECGPKSEGRLDAADRELLAGLARQAALGIHNARLASELAARLDEIRRQAEELSASRLRIVEAQDAERRRIERNIHDGVQQQIVALVAKLRLARNELRRDAAAADALLAGLQHEARQTLEELRELARGIHPPVLADRGLLEAIEACAARLPLGVAIECDGAMRGVRHPDEIEASAYFLVSEALANVLKHASATSVVVRLAEAGATLRVEIADDGVGFKPAAASGSGLTGLHDRIEAVGGVLRVVSAPGAGTTIAAELPVGAREASPV